MIAKESVYLDHAAATPVADFVLAAMQPYFSDRFFNPSSPYAPALAVRQDYEAAKAKIAAVIGVKSDELIMTSGATESINLIFGSMTGHVVASHIEHAAVLAAAKQHPYTLIAPTAKGDITASSVRAALTPTTQLVSIGLANNEIGTIQSLNDISLIIKAERQNRIIKGNTTPLYFHTDASQGAGQLDLHVSRLGVDAMTLNAGKVYGPKQVGLLWAASHVTLQPQLHGGGQERGLRSGTENVAGVIGFAEALHVMDKHRKANSNKYKLLRDSLRVRLMDAFPDAIISGNQKHQLANFLHISFPGIDAERLIFMLESMGVYVATGSACAANKGTRSHVLTAVGLAPEVADGSLRITLGKLNDETSVKRAGDCIIKAVMSEKRRVGKL